MSFVCLSYPQNILSFVSVVFNFNASLNDVVPMSPMWLSIVVMIMEKSDLLMDVFCVSSFFGFHSSD